VAFEVAGRGRLCRLRRDEISHWRMRP
jgi:hypothetical protein